MSMLISRRPADLTPAPARDIYNAEGKSLASTLEKGFPYDDWVFFWNFNLGDVDAQNWKYLSLSSSIMSENFN